MDTDSGSNQEHQPPSVLAKAVSVLDALSKSRVAGVSEIGRQTGLAKTTAHRTLQELQKVGLVERTGDAYRLAPKLFELGNRVPGRRTFREAALPYLEHLAYITNKTVHLGVLEGTEVFYVERLVGGQPSDVPSTVAERRPLHCTATGKCILAFGPSELRTEVLDANELLALTSESITDPRALERELQTVVDSGLANEVNEVSIGFCSIAAPIRKTGGSLAGALSATGPLDTYDRKQVSALVEEAATALSHRLGYRTS